MTQLDHDNAEWRYRFEERLGLLCGADKPSHQQETIAFREANLWREGEIEMRRPARAGKHASRFDDVRTAVDAGTATT